MLITRSPTASRGFTLLELLFVVAITLILSTMVVPAMAELLATTRAQMTTGKLINGLSLARQLAASEQRRQTLCVSDDGITCDKLASRQLLVFSDANNNKQVDADELRYQFALQDGDRAHLRLRVSAGRHYLRYRSDGTAIDYGSLLYCPGDNTDSYARLLIINAGGRWRLASDANGDGIVEGTDGNNISCEPPA